MIAAFSGPREAAGEKTYAGDQEPSLGADDGLLEVLGKAAVASEPGEGAFDDPAHLTESGAVLCVASGDHWGDASSTDEAAVFVVVVAAVGDDGVGSLPGPADGAADRRYR